MSNAIYTNSQHIHQVRMSMVSQEPTLASIPESPTLNEMEFRNM